MTNEIDQLARRAVACSGWRWMPRMRAWFDLESYVILQTLDPVSGAPTVWTKYGARTKFNIFTPEIAGFPTGALPDLADPATIGCLLALVREAVGTRRVSVAVRPVEKPGRSGLFMVDGGELWFVIGDGALSEKPLAVGASEAAALVAALEAAPDREVKS